MPRVRNHRRYCASLIAGYNVIMKVIGVNYMGMDYRSRLTDPHSSNYKYAFIPPVIILITVTTLGLIVKLQVAYPKLPGLLSALDATLLFWYTLMTCLIYVLPRFLLKEHLANVIRLTRAFERALLVETSLYKLINFLRNTYACVTILFVISLDLTIIGVHWYYFGWAGVLGQVGIVINTTTYFFMYFFMSLVLIAIIVMSIGLNNYCRAVLSRKVYGDSGSYYILRTFFNFDCASKRMTVRRLRLAYDLLVDTCDELDAAFSYFVFKQVVESLLYFIIFFNAIYFGADFDIPSILHTNFRYMLVQQIFFWLDWVGFILIVKSTTNLVNKPFRIVTDLLLDDNVKDEFTIEEILAFIAHLHERPAVFTMCQMRVLDYRFLLDNFNLILTLTLFVNGILK